MIPTQFDNVQMKERCRRMTSNFRVLCHHVYEYNKGLRSLVLHTMAMVDLQTTEEFLSKRNIRYHIQIVSPSKFNVFFGVPDCVEIVKLFGNKPLNQLTDEQDFILGIMLGYDRTMQCERYLRRKGILQADGNVPRNYRSHLAEYGDEDDCDKDCQNEACENHPQRGGLSEMGR